MITLTITILLQEVSHRYPPRNRVSFVREIDIQPCESSDSVVDKITFSHDICSMSQLGVFSQKIEVQLRTVEVKQQRFLLGYFIEKRVVYILNEG